MYYSKTFKKQKPNQKLARTETSFERLTKHDTRTPIGETDYKCLTIFQSPSQFS